MKDFEVDDDTTLALAKAIDGMPPVRLTLTAAEALGVVANLQLALRHPDNHGLPAEVARAVIARLAEQLPPVALEIIAFDEQHYAGEESQEFEFQDQEEDPSCR